MCEFCPKTEDTYCGMCNETTPVLPPEPEPSRCPFGEMDLLTLSGAAGQCELADQTHMARRLRALHNRLKAYFNL